MCKRYYYIPVSGGYRDIYSLDHEIQKGNILGVSSPHKLENFHWYHELGPLLGFTKQVFASLRSGAVFV